MKPIKALTISFVKQPTLTEIVSIFLSKILLVKSSYSFFFNSLDEAVGHFLLLSSFFCRSSISDGNSATMFFKKYLHSIFSLSHKIFHQ